MKILIKKDTVREALILAGVVGAAVLASTFIADPSLAVTGDDSIEFVDDLTGGESDLKSLLNTILSYFLGFLFFVCVIMVIYGGILYVTSAGNDENVGKAKKILLYAAIGVVLIMVSFALVSTIFGAGIGGGGGTSGGTTTVQ